MLTGNKTSSLVIDTLREQAYRKGVVVLFFYCDHQAQKDQSAVNMIGSLLGQVVLGAAGIPEEIRRVFEESRQGAGRRLRLPDIVKLFVKIISSIELAYICIDAVDELLPLDRSEFLRALGQIIREAPNTRLFLTGRPNTCGEIVRHLPEGACRINVLVDQGDIARHLSQKMDGDGTQDADMMTEDLENDTMEVVSEKALEK